MADPTPTVIVLSRAGEAVAHRVAEALSGTVHGRADRVNRAEVFFPETLAHIRTLFAAGHPVIGVCAAGILIRAVAPLLADKRTEPPVLAVAEDGSSVAPLLGGHRGANQLASRLAGHLGAVAAITTAGDLALGFASDEPPEGWRLANPQDAGAVTAAILGGARIETEGTLPFNVTVQNPGKTGKKTDRTVVTFSGGLAPGNGSQTRLAYHPLRAALGVGCSRDCPPEELAGLAEAVLTEADITPEAVAAIGSIDLKADEAAVTSLSARLGLPFRVFAAAELEALAPRLANPSATVFAETGCHGVAEGAALALAGSDGELLVEKRKTANATAALALAPEPITALAGRKRGRVALVGLGPGGADWRTPEASRLIAMADELVGYTLYLDLAGPLAHGKPRHAFPLGEEEARCRFALERAGEGCDVALLCSGDAGIYAMGALVFELMDSVPGGEPVSDAAKRVEVITAPGVSAMQAAAARAGAPLGHDFCAISLSDLLTPREDILKRLQAAAEGDFVIALYNPVSRRRRTLLTEAREILLHHRPADCPVVLAKSLGRPEETLLHRRLDQVDTAEADMLTVIIVGSSNSRLTGPTAAPRMFTPRGYGNRKAERNDDAGGDA